MDFNLLKYSKETGFEDMKWDKPAWKATSFRVCMSQEQLIFFYSILIPMDFSGESPVFIIYWYIGLSVSWFVRLVRLVLFVQSFRLFG